MENPHKIIFFVEGTGALSIKEILEKAFEIFKKTIEEFDVQLKDLTISA